MIKTLASGLAWAIAVSSTAAADFGREGVLRQLQFSADGKHVLAQDNSHITVLTVDPLRVLFRVQADQAVLGRFTPDSREIVFVRSMPRVVEGQMPPAQGTPRVERWRLANCTRVASTAIPVLMCGTALLGPDGRTLACADLKGRLHVVDVQAGCEAFTKKEFALGSEQLYLWAADFEFSPDGRFLIVRPEVDGVAVVWDAGEKQLVKARGRIKLLSKHMSREEISPYMRAYGQRFTFVGPDRVAIVRARWPSRRAGWRCSADIVAFPSGDLVSTIELPNCPTTRSFEAGRTQKPFRLATDANFLIINYEVVVDRGVARANKALSTFYSNREKARIDTCAVESKTGRVIHSDSVALDVYGNRYVNEGRPGEVRLWEMGKGLLASIVVSR